jgi:hypothetical protein
MTAEIAILNKLGVALATDSTVTVSVGLQEHKTYDSADKLFDLSHRNPIGIMIYNGLQFMEAPLQTLIAEYRSCCNEFRTVKEAAYDFLRFLNDWGANSPPLVIRNALENLVLPVFVQLKKRVERRQLAIFESRDFTNFSDKVSEIPLEVVQEFLRELAGLELSSFVGGAPPKIDSRRDAIISEIVDIAWEGAEPQLRIHLVSIVKMLIRVRLPAQNQTGIVIAGFGSEDKFPSLISFTIDGVIFDKLRFNENDFVDIDRIGDSARVMPFAQKEMVDRFLYGVDGEIERQIADWCEEAVTGISNALIGALDLADEHKEGLLKKARHAEQTFINALTTKQFEEIRNSSRSSIESMVEFMPKPELARMAEALVNLASLKKRVSRGMDTVGGPIDVAVISRAEGFIWVKRKHYFDSQTNPRYLSRIHSSSSKIFSGSKGDVENGGKS